MAVAVAVAVDTPRVGGRGHHPGVVPGTRRLCGNNWCQVTETAPLLVAAPRRRMPPTGRRAVRHLEGPAYRVLLSATITVGLRHQCVVLLPPVAALRTAAAAGHRCRSVAGPVPPLVATPPFGRRAEVGLRCVSVRPHVGGPCTPTVRPTRSAVAVAAPPEVDTEKCGSK
jgi:hypothetical protein